LDLCAGNSAAFSASAWRTISPGETSIQPPASSSGSAAGRLVSVRMAVDDCSAQILLKNPEIEPPRKSRLRARRVISADSPHGRAHRSPARGKTGRSADPLTDLRGFAMSGFAMWLILLGRGVEGLHYNGFGGGAWAAAIRGRGWGGRSSLSLPSSNLSSGSGSV
jgi:hypothetical protein